MHPDPHEQPRLARFAKDAHQEAFFAALNRVLQDAPLPISSGAASAAARLPLIYIVGTPRSGTTLLSQLVSRHLPVGYINNLIARFYLRPSVGVRLSQALLPDASRAAIDLRSQHGSTRGIHNPHEFGYFWRHWLRLDQAPTHHLSPQARAALDAEGLRRALEEEILAAFGRPVAFKNIICGFHAAFLSRLHPASLFVYITRETEAVAASILRVRKERLGSYRAWWSLKPATYPFDTPNDDPAAEVVMQIKEIRREMEAELAQPGVHSIHLSYAELCAAPRRAMERIAAALEALSYPVGLLPQPFLPLTPPLRNALPADLEARLQACLREGPGAPGVETSG